MDCLHFSFKDLFNESENYDGSIEHFNFNFSQRGGDEITNGPGISLIFDFTSSGLWVFQ